MIKKLAKSALDKNIIWLSNTRPGKYAMEKINASISQRTQQVIHRDVTLQFVVPNSLNQFRVDTFSTKEPETLAWIDSMPKGGGLWDIGANVGLYSCYAAKARDYRVFSFEPSVFNLELLSRNVYQNDLVHQVTIVPLPLTDNLAINTLHLTTTDRGGALSTFGQSYGHDGKTMDKVFEFSTVGISMLDAMYKLDIQKPDSIKMDVDGIEHLILEGGDEILRDVRGVLIEINDAFTEQSTEAATQHT